MNNVVFPLKKGDQGSSVTNLQQALEVMLDRKAIIPVNPRQLSTLKIGLAKEKAENIYGINTLTIVKIFQKNRDLSPDGMVGRRTADIINSYLDEWGLLSQPTEPMEEMTAFEKLIIDNSIKIDAICQLLIHKNIITNDELIDRIKAVQTEKIFG